MIYIGFTFNLYDEFYIGNDYHFESREGRAIRKNIFFI